MKKRIVSLAVTFLLLLFTAVAQNKADDIVGVWLTAGKEPAKVQVYKTGEKYYGVITWLQNPVKEGKPRVDANNPDKSKRNNPIIGLIILKGFKFDGDDEWKGGDIYDPQNGKTYSCFLYLKDKNTLKLRGYIGISLFGRTETWTRSQ
jgi:uncharacterized protein (DUF2147 family)